MPAAETYLSIWSKKPASEVALKVARLLEEWRGLHHFEEALMRKVDWSHPYMVQLTIREWLATFDFSELTSLVFLAHDHCIRVDVCPCNGKYLRLMFHPRVGREGSMCKRHPTIEEALADWRSRHPVEELKETAAAV